MRRALAIATTLLLGACGHTPERVPNPPAPAIIKVPVRVYVPIPPTMTQRCSWVREGELPSEVFAVTEGRKRCLLRYEAQLDTVEAVEGRPVVDD